MRPSTLVQNNAISNRLFDMPQLKASYTWVLKTDRVIIGFGLCPSPDDVAAFVPRVHNYALEIPWTSTEAQANPGSAVRLDRPRTHFFLSVSGSFSREPDHLPLRRIGIQRGHATKVHRVTSTHSS